MPPRRKRAVKAAYQDGTDEDARGAVETLGDPANSMRHCDSAEDQTPDDIRITRRFDPGRAFTDSDSGREGVTTVLRRRLSAALCVQPHAASPHEPAEAPFCARRAWRWITLSAGCFAALVSAIVYLFVLGQSAVDRSHALQQQLAAQQERLAALHSSVLTLPGPAAIAALQRQVEAVSVEARAAAAAATTAKGLAANTRQNKAALAPEWSERLTCMQHGTRWSVSTEATKRPVVACLDPSVPQWVTQALANSQHSENATHLPTLGNGERWVRAADVMPAARIAAVSARFDTSVWRFLKNSRMLRSNAGQLRRAQQVLQPELPSGSGLSETCLSLALPGAALTIDLPTAANVSAVCVAHKPTASPRRCAGEAACTFACSTAQRQAQIGLNTAGTRRAVASVRDECSAVCSAVRSLSIALESRVAPASMQGEETMSAVQHSSLTGEGVGGVARKHVDLPMPNVSGAQACVPVTQGRSQTGVVQSLTLRFSASHGDAPFVCLYGLAVLATD